jgi:hypothetical protein
VNAGPSPLAVAPAPGGRMIRKWMHEYRHAPRRNERTPAALRREPLERPLQAAGFFLPVAVLAVAGACLLPPIAHPVRAPRGATRRAHAPARRGLVHETKRAALWLLAGWRPDACCPMRRWGPEHQVLPVPQPVQTIRPSGLFDGLRGQGPSGHTARSPGRGADAPPDAVSPDSARSCPGSRVPTAPGSRSPWPPRSPAPRRTCGGAHAPSACPAPSHRCRPGCSD